MAEWLKKLMFSALTRSSSHRCGFKPCSGHMRDKPSSACGWSGGFSQGSPVFAPPNDLTWLKLSEIILTGRKPPLPHPIGGILVWGCLCVRLCIRACVHYALHKVKNGKM